MTRAEDDLFGKDKQLGLYGASRDTVSDAVLLRHVTAAKRKITFVPLTDHAYFCQAPY